MQPLAQVIYDAVLVICISFIVYKVTMYVLRSRYKAMKEKDNQIKVLLDLLRVSLSSENNRHRMPVFGLTQSPFSGFGSVSSIFRPKQKNPFEGLDKIFEEVLGDLTIIQKEFAEKQKQKKASEEKAQAEEPKQSAATETDKKE